MESAVSPRVEGVWIIFLLVSILNQENTVLPKLANLNCGNLLVGNF